MKKISEKQKDVIKYMNDNNTYIVFMKGLTPHCFIHHNISYRISIATLFKLEDLKLVEEKNNDWNSAEYHLTEYGKQYFEK